MPEKTDLHKWQYPVRGDGNYESILTALFESIDRDTILVDDDGSRSDYTPKNNALYLTSDTDELYRGDGSSWNLIGTVGGGGSGTDGSYTDADAIAAINDDVDHGSTASHNYTSSASGLSDVSPDSDASAHHEAFTTTDHDGRNHESALSTTFPNASVGEVVTKTSSGWETTTSSGSNKSYNVSATTWGTNGGSEQVIDSIPDSLINQVTALYSTLFNSDGTRNTGTNGNFKIRIYDGFSNVGSSDSSTFVTWNSGEEFTDSPPYLTIADGNKAVIALENNTNDDLRLSFGFEYK